MMRLRLVLVAGCSAWIGGCGFPRPADVVGSDDGGAGGDGASGVSCTANQSLRCDGSNLVHCNGDGTAEVTANCLLGCSEPDLRCLDIDPSNGLAAYLDMAAAEADVDLGVSASIDTSTGAVTTDGNSLILRNTLVPQTSAPSILVFVVRSLIANDVTITGDHAFALVSGRDIQIRGVFAASAVSSTAGPGVFNDAVCQGGFANTDVGQAIGGSGGGGFGSAGGDGGSAANRNGVARGGAAGAPTGNPALIPLRGGCDGGKPGGTSPTGAGGGAIQLVARTKVTVSGVIAANGSSVTGGGSGGGILIEAPDVAVTGSIVANGGAGAGGCFFPQPGQDGRLDATAAMGGMGCGQDGGNGGNGAAGASAAGDGVSIDESGASTILIVEGGYGGGGVGRIRINTAPGGFQRAGLFSPNPSTGSVGVR